MSIKDFVEEEKGAPEKFSRQGIFRPYIPIILTQDGKFVPQYHKTASKIHTHQLSDIEVHGELLLGSGGYKDVYKMGGD